MKSPLDELLARYHPTTIDESWQALREIAQEIILLGLWRGKFFEHAAFYGGTALRIFYGLPRYSEDLDFSLLAPNQDFRLSSYFAPVENEIRAFGFDVSVEERHRTRTSPVESASVKLNTRTSFLSMGVPSSVVERMSREQVLKVKFEIDIDPPIGFGTETRFIYAPQAYSVRLFDLPSIFAGKLSAAIARAWKSRVKGRDWFDLTWFVGKGAPASLAHLRERLVQTGHVRPGDSFGADQARRLLQKRIESLDVESAKHDVKPFLATKESDQLDIWSKEFFLDLAERVRFE
jgi:hypothetical protein